MPLHPGRIAANQVTHGKITLENEFLMRQHASAWHGGQPLRLLNFL
jgi:hypothetical protein